MNRRDLLRALSAASALALAGCRPDPDSATPGTPDPGVEPFDPTDLTRMLDGILPSLPWAQAYSEAPAALLALQAALDEDGMDACARVVGALGEALLPAMGLALMGMDTEDQGAAMSAFAEGVDRVLIGLAVVRDELSAVRDELSAQGWLGAMPGAAEERAALSALEVEARAQLHALGAEDNLVVNGGLSLLREHKAWLADGADGEAAMAQLEAGVSGLLDHIEGARRRSARGPTPPPMADWAEQLCTDVGAPIWIDFILETLFGLSGSRCDKMRWFWEVVILSGLCITGFGAILTLLLGQKAFFGLLIFSGPLGFALGLILLVYFAAVLICRADYLIEVMLECGF